MNHKRAARILITMVAFYSYLLAVPYLITVYLFRVGHSSIIESSGVAESAPILTLAWIAANAVFLFLSYALYMILYGCHQDESKPVVIEKYYK